MIVEVFFFLMSSHYDTLHLVISNMAVGSVDIYLGILLIDVLCVINMV